MDCKSQCYVGTSNMVGAKTDVERRKEEIEPHTINTIKLMGDTLDAASELKTLIKYSPKREGAFNKLWEESAPGISGFKKLCPSC